MLIMNQNVLIVFSLVHQVMPSHESLPSTSHCNNKVITPFTPIILPSASVDSSQISNLAQSRHSVHSRSHSPADLIDSLTDSIRFDEWDIMTSPALDVSDTSKSYFKKDSVPSLPVEVSFPEVSSGSFSCPGRRKIQGAEHNKDLLSDSTLEKPPMSQTLFELCHRELAQIKRLTCSVPHSSQRQHIDQGIDHKDEFTLSNLKIEDPSVHEIPLQRFTTKEKDRVTDESVINRRVVEDDHEDLWTNLRDLLFQEDTTKYEDVKEPINESYGKFVINRRVVEDDHLDIWANFFSDPDKFDTAKYEDVMEPMNESSEDKLTVLEFPVTGNHQDQDNDHKDEFSSSNLSIEDSLVSEAVSVIHVLLTICSREIIHETSVWFW